jgi:hypothetical protein
MTSGTPRTTATKQHGPARAGRPRSTGVGCVRDQTRSGNGLPGGACVAASSEAAAAKRPSEVLAAEKNGGKTCAVAGTSGKRSALLTAALSVSPSAMGQAAAPEMPSVECEAPQCTVAVCAAADPAGEAPQGRMHRRAELARPVRASRRITATHRAHRRASTIAV